jgi:nitroreductase
MDMPRTAEPVETDHLLNARTATEEVILRRRSVRVYKKQQVPEFMIRRILEAGRFAPSAGNCQPWKFIVVRDPDLIRGLTDTTVKICKIFRWLIDYRWTKSVWRRLNAMVNIRLKPNDLHPVPFSAVSLIANRRLSLYHGAPTVILIFKDVRGVSSPDLDCGIAGQNMVLAAHSMGLGTCWVGFTKLAFQYGRKWKKAFGVSYPYKFASSLSIGWPVSNPDGMVERPVHTVDWYENGIRSQVD